MKSWRSVLPVLVAVAVVAGASIAMAARTTGRAARSTAHATRTTAHAANTLRGPRGRRGPRGLRGKTGAVGPQGPQGQQGQQGPQGPAASSGETSFNAAVASGQTETINVGQFTLRENAGIGGACNPVTIQDNSSVAGLMATGAAGTFGTSLTTANPVAVAKADTANNLFAATLINGISEVNGNVSDITIPSANACVTTGYMQGS